MPHIDGVDTALCGAGQPLGYQVDGDDPVAQMICDARGHIPDRTQPEYGDRATVGNVGVRHRLPGGR